MNMRKRSHSIDVHLPFSSFSSQMAENSFGVVVTEEMLTKEAGIGDLERLTLRARQGVRVTSGEPLYAAVCSRDVQLEVLRCLVRELGADVRQTHTGDTPLIVAARWGSLTVMRCLNELGADVNEAMLDGETPLLTAAHAGSLVQALER
jgi:ankyrin repeat protein